MLMPSTVLRRRVRRRFGERFVLFAQEKTAAQGGAIAFFVLACLLVAFSTVACAGASENAEAGTLPKNIWPQDLARQGGATAFF